MSCCPHLFSRAMFKGNSFCLLCGGHFHTLPQNPALAGSLTILKRVFVRVQKEGDFGNKIAWGGVGWRGKEANRMHKK